MKKFFSFAIALVTCALVFTSCEQKIDSPLVGGWTAGRGTLEVVNPIDNTVEVRECSVSINFFDNGRFQHDISLLEEADASGYSAIRDSYSLEGSWTVDGDKLTLRKEKYGLRHDGQMTYSKDYKPSEELVKWVIDGHHLKLTRNLGTDKEYEEVYSDGKM